MGAKPKFRAIMKGSGPIGPEATPPKDEITPGASRSFRSFRRRTDDTPNFVQSQINVLMWLIWRRPAISGLPAPGVPRYLRDPHHGAPLPRHSQNFSGCLISKIKESGMSWPFNPINTSDA
jgi:hypothetical protein